MRRSKSTSRSCRRKTGGTRSWRSLTRRVKERQRKRWVSWSWRKRSMRMSYSRFWIRREIINGDWWLWRWIIKLRNIRCRDEAIIKILILSLMPRRPSNFQATSSLSSETPLKRTNPPSIAHPKWSITRPDSPNLSKLQPTLKKRIPSMINLSSIRGSATLEETTNN